MADTLPEGTDRILPGASDTSRGDADDAIAQVKAGAADLREAAVGKAGEFRAQAEDKARDFAAQGKDRATGALDEISRLIGENATQIDEKLGTQYGDYARRAADAVSGAAETLRGKEIDDLLDDARDLVRRSPGIAIAAAATAGFFLARVIKAGSEALEASTAEVAPARELSAAARKPGKAKRGDAA